MIEVTAATPAFAVSLSAGGIASLVWRPGSRCSLGEAQQTVLAIDRLTAGRVVPLMIDMRSVLSTDREAREFYASTEARWTGVAFVVGSALSKMIANFSLGLKPHALPTRLFTSEAAAVDWLNGLTSG